MNSVVSDLLYKLEQCDDYHNRCDYLMEHRHLKRDEVVSTEEKQDLEKKFKDIRQIRTRFGLVFQQFNLFPQYTAFENIKLSLALREKEKAGCRYSSR
mgnify:CR=1 FL=1